MNEDIDYPVECPYNPMHRIAKSRIQYHIVRCEKNYPAGYRKICPYNASHRIPASEFNNHIETCPAKEIVTAELHVHEHTNKCGSMRYRVEKSISSVIDCDEDWDLESENNSVYDSVDKDVSDENDVSSVLLEYKSVDNDLNGDMRKPRSSAEAVMKDDDTETIGDMESVISSWGIGRGSISRANLQLLKAIGRGRGKSLN